jgi:hypothetical protein
VLWTVAGVEGVRKVQSDLEVHEGLPDTVQRRSPFLHTRAPAVRAIALSLAAIALVALRRR